MTTINQKIGKKIKQLRKQAKMSQEDLAFEAKVDYSYLNQIESGKKNPSVKRISDIAKALSVKISDIFN